jgi:hypothetical protein
MTDARVRLKSMAYALAVGLSCSVGHAHPQDKDFFQVMCEPGAWTDFVPNSGRVIIAESSFRFMYSEFEWASPSNLDWFAVQQHSALEVEAVVDGYAVEIKNLAQLPDEDEYRDYRVLPCAYPDTQLFDVEVNIGVGSACAGEFESGRLYYMYVRLEPEYDVSWPMITQFRVQRARWAGDWWDDFGLDHACYEGAVVSYQSGIAPEYASNCIFSCHEHDFSQDYRFIRLPSEEEIEQGKNNTGPFPLPMCMDWEFKSDPASLHYCTESVCDDARDNDYDGLFDCEDPDCLIYSVCADCSYSVTDYECPVFSPASGPSADPEQSGGEIMKVCGTVDPETAEMVLKVRKHDGSDFGQRPYVVRVSGANDGECVPGKMFEAYDDVPLAGIGSSELRFTFDSVWFVDQDSKAYCVTASTQPGDQGYDPNDPNQKSWWWSKKITVDQQCK